MGIASYRIKIDLYVFVVVIVGILFGVRVYNAWQKTNYTTEVVFRDGDIQISLHYPVKILSSKNDASYPLILSFSYTGDITEPHTYEIFLQSSTLLFVDAKGSELTPRFQFTSDQMFFEQSMYVRPYLSKEYHQKHLIDVSMLVDGKPVSIQSQPVEIAVVSHLFSFLSLAAASFLEISILGALVTWIANAIDTALNLRKELIIQIRNELNSLASLPYLERLRTFVTLEEQIRSYDLESDLMRELQQMRISFADSEREFMRAVGEQLRQEG
ncbi:MAG: hypothetical protein HUU11_06830 [Anaerolineales bacterium]|nr:hypothetical protein [Anaerolineales bacterium]NUQ84410.1 hypothetical protein [Anaerolineales bacterium]